MECPQYRVRLFLSADLVGSTAFKANAGQIIPSDQLNPLWVQEVNGFYRSFPATFQRIFKESKVSGDEFFASYDIPQIWKTIGDEIVCVCRLSDLNHLAYCINAFIQALDSYSEDLAHRCISLDIKGCGWLAAFPAPNVTIFDKSKEPDSTEIIDEGRERQADLSPREHDFLGQEIDSGFRVARFSEANCLSVSAGLALALCDAAYHRLFSQSFNYHGRHVLKGVARGNAYPIVSVDIERDVNQREVRNYERAVVRNDSIIPIHLANFLRSYMKNENLDIPILKERKELVEGSDLPECYSKYVEKWKIGLIELNRMNALANESAITEPDGDNENLNAIESDITETIDFRQDPTVKPSPAVNVPSKSASVTGVVNPALAPSTLSKSD